MGKNKKRRRAERRSDARTNPAPKGPSDAGGSDAGRGAWLHAKSPALRFVVITGALMALFYWVFYTPPEESPALDAFIRTYLHGYAVGAAFLLDLFGFNAKADGTTVFLDFLPVEVVRGCDAMEPIALYVAAVIAVPMSWREKLVGVFGGVAALAAINTIRIAILSYVSSKHQEFFETAHLTIAQTVFILCTVSLWVLWAMWASAREGRRSDDAAAG